MFDIFNSLLNYVDYYPLVAFIGLLIAGLNLPVSEDLIIITGALVCHEKPYLIVPTLAVIFFTVLGTDCFVYWLGTRVSKGVVKSKFFTRLIPKRALDKMRYYLDKYGIFTFIVCRFIPFGVRNTLFFTSGLSGLRFRLFILYDITAALININTLFFLTYHFGSVATKPIMIAGLIFFIILVSGVVTLIIRLIISYRRKRAAKRNALNEEGRPGE